MNYRARIGETWLAIAEMNGRVISQNALRLMLDAVSDLKSDAVLNALNVWVKTTKQNRHPTPAEIRELVSPQVNDDALAREAAIRIQQAIAKYGYMGGEDAEAFIGEIGWQVVRRFGGWRYICENHGIELNPLTFHAQARDIAKTQIEMARAGIMNQAPQLDHAQNIQLEQNRSGLQRLDFNKLIETKERE